MNILRMRWPVTIVAILCMYVGLFGSVGAFGAGQGVSMGLGLVVFFVGVGIGTYAHGLERDDKQAVFSLGYTG